MCSEFALNLCSSKMGYAFFAIARANKEIAHPGHALIHDILWSFAFCAGEMA